MQPLQTSEAGMTSDDIRRIRWALKKGPRMGRKERARYLQELVEDYEDEQDVENGTSAEEDADNAKT